MDFQDFDAGFSSPFPDTDSGKAQAAMDKALDQVEVKEQQQQPQKQEEEAPAPQRQDSANSESRSGGGGIPQTPSTNQERLPLSPPAEYPSAPGKGGAAPKNPNMVRRRSKSVTCPRVKGTKTQGNFFTKHIAVELPPLSFIV